jgi:deoxyribodipyrimidine photolyase
MKVSSLCEELFLVQLDLRVHDQPALSAACTECDEILPLFVFDEQ